MNNHKKSLLVGWVLIVVSIVLLIADELLLDCVVPAKPVIGVLSYLDIALSGAWILVILGIMILTVTRVLYRKKLGYSYPQIAGELIALVIISLFLYSVVLEVLFASERRLKSPDSYIISNLNSMRFSAEIYFNLQESYEGFCASESPLNTQEKIQNVPYQGLLCRDYQTKVTCVDSKDAYAVSAILSAGEQYWCFDSIGLGVRTKEPPTGPSCEVTQ